MKKTILIASLLFMILFIQTSSSLNATSSSYSFSMFGNGMVTGKGYSNSYNSTFLSETAGTTRSAESSSFRANIGFFEESAYLRTVSISSYSISPKSAVVGSTIGLFVTALNAQSVWAQVTSPNSQVQILNLVNGQTLNYLPVPSVVGRYDVVFYANDSTGAVTSVVDFFDLTSHGSSSSGISSGSGGGSGGGTTRVIERCNYNWDCTPWNVCSDNIQSRTCKNIGTCVGNESKPIEQMQCSESLFDIALILDKVKFTAGNINFNINLDEKIGLEKIDVHVKYSIINSTGYEVFSQIETKAVEKSLSYDKTLDGFNLVDGDYILRVDVLYGNLQRAFAEQKFSILNGELNANSNGITGFAGSTYGEFRGLNIYFIILAFVIVGVLLVAYRYFARKPFNDEENGLLSKVNGLEVYTDTGIKVGRVYGVVIRSNRIYGLVVDLDKDVPVKYSRALIRYEFVRNVRDVVVVDSRIFSHNPQGVSA